MDGVINVLKPAGMTSFDVVSAMRRIFHQKKVGHGGTLDPMAAGVLPVFLGKMTRLISYVPLSPKTYEAEFVKGISTDTEDMTGTVLHAEKPEKEPDWEHIARQFTGTIQQVPSSYSAIKIHGERAYDLARKGEKFEIPSREVTLYQLSVVSEEGPYLRLSATCSSGTYIRALVRDLGRAASVPLTMSFLLRTAMGPFTISKAWTLEEIGAHPEECVITDPGFFLGHLPRVDLTQERKKDFLQGKRWHVSLQEAPVCTVFSDHEFLGIAQVLHGIIHPKKVFQ
jgi:tRNA pseudouridine55 synthase